MWYSIVSEDVKNSLDLRLKARPAHLETADSSERKRKATCRRPSAVYR